MLVVVQDDQTKIEALTVDVIDIVGAALVIVHLLPANRKLVAQAFREICWFRHTEKCKVSNMIHLFAKVHHGGESCNSLCDRNKTRRG